MLFKYTLGVFLVMSLYKYLVLISGVMKARKKLVVGLVNSSDQKSQAKPNDERYYKNRDTMDPRRNHQMFERN